MTADIGRLEKLSEACVSAEDYEGAERYANEALKSDPQCLFALLTKAKIACSKSNTKDILDAVKLYKKAISCKEAKKDVNKSVIREGLQKSLVQALYASCNEMLGEMGFEAYMRKSHFISFAETLEKTVSDACGKGEVIPKEDILKSLSMLLQKSATYMRNELNKRAESSLDWLTEGEQYSDYKKSIDACIQIVDYSIKRETDTARKVKGYEKIIAWLDARTFSATNEPTENMNTGDTQYTLIDSLSNPEVERLSEQRAVYTQALEVQKYIQALELLQERKPEQAAESEEKSQNGN